MALADLPRGILLRSLDVQRALTMIACMLSLALDVRCFLDVDDLEDVSLLEEYVQSSRTVVVFLSGSFAPPPGGAQKSDNMAREKCLHSETSISCERKSS